MQMIKIERVLVPVDGSASSREAAVYAAHLVNARNPRLYLMHVWEPIPMTIGGEEAAELREEAETEAVSLLEEYRTMIDGSGILDVELISRSGRPDYEILNVQEELDCDLIVIGSRGMSELESVIMGSVVSGVLEGATCPVLVTRNLRAKYLRELPAI
jgi:nucleotide-binding universal stress UspA family protein